MWNMGINQWGSATVTWEIRNFPLLVEAAAADKSLWSPPWKVQHSGGGTSWGKMFAWHTGSRVCFDVAWFEEGRTLNRCEMSFVSPRGEVIMLQRETTRRFSVEKNDLLERGRQSIIPDGTLTLRCRMWEKTMMSPQESRIYSVLQSVQYDWVIEMFDPSTTYTTLVEEDDLLLRICLSKETENSTYELKVSEGALVLSCMAFVECALSFKDGRGRVVGKTWDHRSMTCNIDIFTANTTINIHMKILVSFHKSCQSNECSNAVSKNILFYLTEEKNGGVLTAESHSAILSSAKSWIVDARSPLSPTTFQQQKTSKDLPDVVVLDDLGQPSLDLTHSAEDKFLPSSSFCSTLNARSPLPPFTFQQQNTSKAMPNVVSLRDLGRSSLAATHNAEKNSLPSFAHSSTMTIRSSPSPTMFQQQKTTKAVPVVGDLIDLGSPVQDNRMLRQDTLYDNVLMTDISWEIKSTLY